MNNEETIYACPNDTTKWYGSNQSPEVCPVCGAEGIVDVPQEFDSSADQAAVVAEVEAVPVIEEPTPETTPEEVITPETE